MPLIVWTVYCLIGAFVGAAYAFLTGASLRGFIDSGLPLAVIGAPALLLFILVARRCETAYGLRGARFVYHPIIAALGMPIVCFAAAIGLGALGYREHGAALYAMRYWTIPMVIMGVAAHAIARYWLWHRLTGSGTAPPSGPGSTGGQPTTAQRAEATESHNEPPGTKRVAWVLSLSRRGGPSRWVPRLVEDPK